MTDTGNEKRVDVERIEQPIKPRSKWYRLKRIGWAILLPILLIVAAGLLWIVSGGGSVTEKVNNTLAEIWLPMTCFRLAAYTVLAYHIIPWFIRRSAIKNESMIALWQMQYEQAEESDKILLDNMIAHAQIQGQAYDRYLQNRHWILIALIIFDGLMIQLPYWIK